MESICRFISVIVEANKLVELYLNLSYKVWTMLKVNEIVSGMFRGVLSLSDLWNGNL